MDVFGIALATGGELLRDAAIDAVYELGLADALPASLAELGGSHRLRALLDYLVALDVLARDGERFVVRALPARPVVARAGWGLMADVIRTDKPLPVPGGDVELRYHEHLARVGAPAARELASLVGGGSLVDLGAGAGAYTAAFLDAHPTARATVVDYAEVITLPRRALARFVDRVRFVASDIRTADTGGDHDVVLLANVLHLHAPAHCARLVAAAARMLAPGGALVIKDLRVDDGRRGPFEGLAFALNMAIYTGGGDVHDTALLRGWLRDAGLAGITEHRLASQPDGIVLIGYRPRSAAATFVATTGLTASLALPDTMPPAFRTLLAHAVAALGPGPEADNLVAHYTRVMPALRESGLQHPLFQMPLDWARLPRLAAVVDRWAAAAGAASIRPPTLAALYERTYYGGFMPLLYGYPADLAYFTSRGLDPHATIDRYLVAPILHELCHFDRDRDALLPPHLDECIAGWTGVHLWPELAYPEGDHDDAIYAAPWLAQVGQAVARAFGVDATIRAHAGHAPWHPAFLAAATRLGWADWCARRTQHFLSDTFDPAPWVALALAAGAGRPLAGITLAELARIPLAELALPPDPALDRAIARDALRAMCLANTRIDGSFRTRSAVPTAPIVIDARACTVTTAARGELDRVPPRYWLPPAIAAGMRARGVTEHRIALASLADIPRVVDELARYLPAP